MRKRGEEATPLYLDKEGEKKKGRCVTTAKKGERGKGEGGGNRVLKLSAIMERKGRRGEFGSKRQITPLPEEKKKDQQKGRISKVLNI